MLIDNMDPEDVEVRTKSNFKITKIFYRNSILTCASSTGRTSHPICCSGWKHSWWRMTSCPMRTSQLRRGKWKCEFYLGGRSQFYLVPLQVQGSWADCESYARLGDLRVDNTVSSAIARSSNNPYFCSSFDSWGMAFCIGFAIFYYLTCDAWVRVEIGSIDNYRKRMNAAIGIGPLNNNHKKVSQWFVLSLRIFCCSLAYLYVFFIFFGVCLYYLICVCG